MQQKVAVVILNYNGKKFLERFLKDVIHLSAPHQVIVADNASTDDSIAYLKHHFPDLTLIQNSVNTGYAGGYNEALKHINVDYFVLLNNDVEVSTNWLQPLIEFMSSNEGVAACQPKLLDQNHKNLFEYAGASGGFIDKYGYPFCRGRIFESIEEDKGQYDDTREVFWVSGACLMVRSNIFWELGGFDTDYFAHMEEIDLCWRIQNLGHKVYVVPQSKVYHVGAGTLKKQSAQKTYLNFKNSLVTLTKNHPSKGLFSKILMRLLLDGVAGSRFALKLQFGQLIAILQAHASYYWNLDSTLNKRKALKQLNGYQLKFDNTYPHSIVYAHFIKGIKKFADIYFK